MLFVYSGNEVWPSEGVCLPNVIKNAFNILTSIGFEFYLFNETRFRSYLGIFWGHLDSSKVESSREKSKKKKIFFEIFLFVFLEKNLQQAAKKRKQNFFTVENYVCTSILNCLIRDMKVLVSHLINYCQHFSFSCLLIYA